MTLKPKTLYAVMAIGAVIGIVAAFIQLIDTIVLLQNKDAVLACNINSVFSCSTVLQSWQNWLFGFPNAIICLTLFVIFATSAVAGWSGAKMPRVFRLAVQGLTLFTLCFALWVLWQDTYAIGALCILCLFCFVGLLMLNWGWLRLNVQDLPVSKKVRARVAGWIAKGYDTLAWATIAAIMAILMVQRFAVL